MDLLLLGVGVVLAFVSSLVCGGIALTLALAILLYDKFSKHHSFFGPLNMGLCRGLNLLMGIAYLGSFEHWYYCMIPIIFIFAITMVSQGEVHGNNKSNILLAGILYGIVVFLVIYLNQKNTTTVQFSIPFILFFAIMVLVPLF